MGQINVKGLFRSMYVAQPMRLVDDDCRFWQLPMRAGSIVAVIISVFIPVNALSLLVGRPDGHSAGKDRASAISNVRLWRPLEDVA